MRDWNKDGKIDRKDQMMDYYIFEQTEKDSDHYQCGGGRSGGGVLKGTIIVIIVILLLAFILGVEVPAAVWGFFVKVILVVAFFTVLGKLFR